MPEQERLLTTYSIEVIETVTTVEHFLIDHFNKPDAERLAVKRMVEPHHAAKFSTTRKITSTQGYPKQKNPVAAVDELVINA